ncbi:histidine--tRNA ligase [PVC group bacterium]|nr:histidine--tRNA ligase [PVC group bacterium]
MTVKNQKSNKLSTAPYKGVRDFYPEDAFIQEYIFRIMKRVVEKFGYVVYNASILENTNLYLAKSAEEIVLNQTYTFMDRGGRPVTLRPEMTPTIARMIAKKRKEMVFPARLYSIANMFRYERPQKGRLREHWQLNADIFGVSSIDAESELITLAHELMIQFGAQPDHFRIRVNHRELLYKWFVGHMKLTTDLYHKVTKLMDRRLKMSDTDFKNEVTALIGCQNQEKFWQMIHVTSLSTLPDELKGEKCTHELRSLFEKMKARNLVSIVFDPTLVRGFDYYTGVVFEIYDLNPENNRSLFGGGRFDDILNVFGVEKIPACGFGMGDVTIRDFMETYQLLPDYQSSTDVYVCGIGPDAVALAEDIAHQLRLKGLNTASDLTGRKIASQIKTAVKQAIPFALFVGEDERSSGRYKLKHLKDGHAEVLSLDDVCGFVRKKIRQESSVRA